MNITYLTYPWYLDVAIEYIKGLSESNNVDVVIVCPLDRLESTIYKIERSDFKDKYIYDFNEIDFLAHKDLLKEYFVKANSVKFVFLRKKWYDPKNFGICKNLLNKLKASSPDIVHFDDLYFYLFWLKLFRFKFKYVVNVHDPIPHSGERDWKRDLIRFLFFKQASRIITYSSYSFKLFVEAYPAIKRVSELRLPYYSFYPRLAGDRVVEGKYILFFGRVSPYKGVDKLLQAFSSSPNPHGLKLVVAGKSIRGYSLPEELISGKNVLFINRFIDNYELASLIRHSSAVVCPYIDATQSGVVMTSLAFNKYMLVSDVGALSEPINEENGLIFSYKKMGDFENKLKYVLTNMPEISHSSGSEQGELKLQEDIQKLINIYESV